MVPFRRSTDNAEGKTGREWRIALVICSGFGTNTSCYLTAVRLSVPLEARVLPCLRLGTPSVSNVTSRSLNLMDVAGLTNPFLDLGACFVR
jgi:hypothetical protein